MIGVNGFHHYFSRYVYLVGGDSFRCGELLDGKYILFMCCSRGFVAELVKVYKGFGYREDEGGCLAWWDMCPLWEVLVRGLQFGVFPQARLYGR